MTLIDAIYIHNSGGKVLLEILIKKILKTNLNSFFFLFDSRLEKSLISNIDPNSFKILKASEYNRAIFYRNKYRKFYHYFCFANVPPPIQLNKPVTIYFHNDLILDSKNSGVGFLKRFKFQIKKKYIYFNNNKNYHWVVQTSLMMKKLSNEFKINPKKIYVLPFFNELVSFFERPVIKNTFLYVANYSPHKNHEKLIKAFQEVAFKTDKKIILKLTLEEKQFDLLIQKTNYFTSNFLLINLGILTKDALLKSYQEANFFIYPSLKESFGLPLVEAAIFSGYILASDLDYIHEVVIPSLTFNPYNKSEIASVILKVLNLKKVKESKLKVSNKIDDLLTHITNYV
ncbi:MAG: hypothetical protein CBD39_02830 [Flavobacteriaceae bacterium TMED179]|nr:MAG: hypothetical protein CBD39_02830 [Flavobacteriaceae bacterium TMED179]|tara:strand:+ start:11108 stop:12136 length:1029 start_codon:yes stop_codon:yes gene_type:complete